VATAAIDKINKPHDLPKVKQAPVNWGGGLMVIPHPKEVLNIMKSIPYGRTLTLDEIRAKLAKDHNSDIACPMTTGIFVSLAAQAYEEGSVHVSYWRTLKRDGELNARFPGGIETHKEKLESEGHIVFAKGKRLFVKNREEPDRT
jgi:alkylated DNA nucleotide flippase Atl1|tara:strand:+ start:158 stop:592 length:435 start_codon:yes stop_codon:yes gene_type:complete